MFDPEQWRRVNLHLHAQQLGLNESDFVPPIEELVSSEQAL